MIEMFGLGVLALVLVGGGVALRFARAAAVGDDEPVPDSQRDTIPASAPPTLRSSEQGREFGEEPAVTPWL